MNYNNFRIESSKNWRSYDVGEESLTGQSKLKVVSLDGLLERSSDLRQWIGIGGWRDRKGPGCLGLCRW